MPQTEEQGRHDETMQRMDDLNNSIQRLTMAIGTLIKSNNSMLNAIAQLTSIMSSRS